MDKSQKDVSVMATYASEILYSDDYRKAIKEAMAKDCRYEDEHDGFENFSADSDHWLVIAEMLESKATLITELVGALENALDDLNTDIRWANDSQLEGLIERRTKLEAALSKAKDQTNDR